MTRQRPVEGQLNPVIGTVQRMTEELLCCFRYNLKWSAALHKAMASATTKKQRREIAEQFLRVARRFHKRMEDRYS